MQLRGGLRMVSGLANGSAATLITTRADEPFASIDDLWRRAGIPVTALLQLAEADAFRSSLKLARREALWAIKALRDEPLPLFAAGRSPRSQDCPGTPRTRGGAPVHDRRRRSGRGLWPCGADVAKPSSQFPAQ
jgi:error-prone DNA polymerase